MRGDRLRRMFRADAEESQGRVRLRHRRRRRLQREKAKEKPEEVVAVVEEAQRLDSQREGETGAAEISGLVEKVLLPVLTEADHLTSSDNQTLVTRFLSKAEVAQKRRQDRQRWFGQMRLWRPAGRVVQFMCNAALWIDRTPPWVLTRRAASSLPNCALCRDRDCVFRRHTVRFTVSLRGDEPERTSNRFSTGSSRRKPVWRAGELARTIQCARFSGTTTALVASLREPSIRRWHPLSWRNHSTVYNLYRFVLRRNFSPCFLFRFAFAIWNLFIYCRRKYVNRYSPHVANPPHWLCCFRGVLIEPFVAALPLWPSFQVYSVFQISFMLRMMLCSSIQQDAGPGFHFWTTAL